MVLDKKSLTTIRNYEVQERLGEGAGGTVYRAFDNHLHRPVVIKLLHRTDTSADQMVRLMEEARLASAIEHPNVCTVYEAGELDGQPYLVMQYVPGRTLLEFITEGPLSEAFALSIGVQIAGGLVAAHGHGILHRDLKPANVMITDDGLAKILDFGLARRTFSEHDRTESEQVPERSADAVSTRFGTTAYMAPEQFVTRRSTEQSDVWALGVILYEMVTGRHPFWLPSPDQTQLTRAIQFHTITSPGTHRPELHSGFTEIIMKALAKQPDERYRQASELRDALKTLTKTVDPDAQAVPGEPSLPAPLAERPSSRNGMFAKLADRLLPERTSALPHNAVAILPFVDYGTEPSPPFYGFALADAVATRLSQVRALLVRPPRMLRATNRMVTDPIDAGRQLAAAYVLSGQFARTPTGYHLSWKLLSVDTNTVVTGQTTEIAASELVTVQHRLSEEVYAVLESTDELPISTSPLLRPAAAIGEATIPDDVAEEYLAARALLNSQATRSSHQDDLERARQTFESVIEQAPDFAPAHASLGITLTRYVRFGFGGVRDLIAAQRVLEKALELDASNIEAKLYRAYTLLWRGEKEQARRDIQYLLRTAAYDAEVHIGAGVNLHLDGLLDDALHAFSTALSINPTLGTRVYNFRAQIYGYKLDLERAHQEIQKGLALESQHTLLRTSYAAWHLRRGDVEEALTILESVIDDDPNLRLAHPTLAIAYHRAGSPERGAALMTDETLAMATADCEMAYRVATYFAVAENAPEALHWLRRAIYLGNHNAPWFTQNPDWEAVRDHDDIRQTLTELTEVQRHHRERWKRVLLAAERSSAPA